MLHKRPTHFFLCAGNAEGKTPLNAFDMALLKAGVGDLNLIRLSSILPPDTRRSERRAFRGGGYLPIAYGYHMSETPGETISAAVAVAIPVDPALPGVIMEFSGTVGREEAERTVRAMAEEALRYRDRPIREILSISVEHVTGTCGAAFAGVALYPEEDAL